MVVYIKGFRFVRSPFRPVHAEFRYFDGFSFVRGSVSGPAGDLACWTGLILDYVLSKVDPEQLRWMVDVSLRLNPGQFRDAVKLERR